MINGYGICLNEWLEDEQIKTELRLLIKISSLTADKGYCFAGNNFFAEYFNTTTVTISKQIKKLERLSYIEIHYIKKGAQVTERHLRLKKTLTDGYRKLKPTVKENFKDNSITNNNINTNNIDKESKIKISDNSSKKQEVSKNKKTPTTITNPIVKECSEYFPDDILKRLTVNDKRNWVKTVDELLRLDEYSKEEIIQAVKFGRQGFWAQNFLSLTKLRKKDKQGVKYISVFLNQSKANDSTDDGSGNFEYNPQETPDLI